MRNGLIIPVALLALPTHLLGQATDTLRTGARVRLSVAAPAADTMIGTFAGWQADSLLLDHESGTLRVLPVKYINRLEVSRGTKSNAGTGAIAGLLVGAVATALFLVALCEETDTPCQGDEFFLAFAIIAPLPTALGALMGAAARSERWESIPLSQLTPETIRPRGLSIGLAWRF